MKIEATARDSASGSVYAAKSSEREFHIIAETSSETDKKAVCDAFSEYVENRIPFDDWGNPVADDGISVECDADGNGAAWTGRVRYEAPEERDDAEALNETSDDENAELAEYGFKPNSFSTTGGTARITRSFETTAYPIEGSAINFGGGIGWNGEEFEGCDVVAPAFSFDVEATTPQGFIASFGSFANRIARQVGTVNSAPFLGFLPGTVLFQGISSARRQTTSDASGGKYDYWTLTYSFSASPHITFNVGGVTISKPGWAYFWTLTEKSYDAASGEIVPFLRAAYVEQVYRSTDFSLLSIGG